MEIEYRGAPKEAFEGRTAIYLENMSLFSDGKWFSGSSVVCVDGSYTRAFHYGETLEEVADKFKKQFPEVDFYYVTME